MKFLGKRQKAKNFSISQIFDTVKSFSEEGVDDWAPISNTLYNEYWGNNDVNNNVVNDTKSGTQSLVDTSSNLASNPLKKEIDNQEDNSIKLNPSKDQELESSFEKDVFTSTSNQLKDVLKHTNDTSSEVFYDDFHSNEGVNSAFKIQSLIEKNKKKNKKKSFL